VLNGLKGFEPRVVRADAFTNLPQGFSFLQKRGFYEAFRETPVQLDVISFNPSPYAWLETRLKAQGIAIKTLREMEDDPARDRKLFELYREADADLPREEGEIMEVSFKEWVGWGLNDPTTLPDAYFIAMKGDEYVGLRELGKYPGGDILLGSLLGVRRAYRKRGIGLALQLRSIAYAREHGYRLLKTCTALKNTPMQNLFNKLGYTRGPEWLQCQKDI
jgi:GNAT superfamily N-acetyltransferase